MGHLGRAFRTNPAVPGPADRGACFARWPHVKKRVPHHTPYSYGRMPEAWLDR